MNLSTYTQLIVRESQEAVLLSKGRRIGKFGPGKHTLDTENLPGLREFFGIPFGGKNPFTAEIWFVNKLVPLNIEWETDAMMYPDPDYQTMVPVLAKGRYGLRVEEAERFLLQLVGTAEEFTASQLTDHFRGEFVTKAKTAIHQYMLAQRIGVQTVNACLTVLSEALLAALSPFWERFGFSLAGFYVTSVEVDSQSKAGERILDAMSIQSKLKMVGSSYQQEQMLDIARQAVTSGSGGGLLGAVMLSGMFGGGGMTQQAPPMLPGASAPAGFGPPAPAPPRVVYCSNCAKKYTGDVKFCPHCGDPYMPCPRCSADNAAGAQRCVSCGTGLNVPAAITNTCSRCRASLNGNPAFCPNCGNKVTY